MTALPDVVSDLHLTAFESADMDPHRRRVHRNRNAPAVIRRILDGLPLDAASRVLQIGTGSGYVAAVLGRLAAEVISVEQRADVAEVARERLAAAGIDRVEVVEADGQGGWPDGAPYDAILVSARTARVPRALVDQLRPGGALVAFVGLYRARQTLVRLARADSGEVVEESLGEVRLLSRLEQILVELGAMTVAESEAARALAVESGRPLEALLRARFQIGERDLVRAVALQRGFRVGDISRLVAELDPATRSRVAEPFARFNRAVPVRCDDGMLVVATSNPEADFDGLIRPFDEARRVRIHLLTDTDFERLWKADPEAERDEVALVAPVAEADLLDEGAHLSRFTEVFRALLLEAVAEGASDLHLERYGNRVRVRLRVDGALYDATSTALSVADLVGVVNVVKVQAQLDIADRNHPQGGRFRTHAGREVFDLRVQTQPALDGEHVVIRLLSHRGAQRSIDGLGFAPAVARSYRRLLQSPQGLVLVVGPTGSGKSTTLYAGLQILADDGERKVITVEDPIEYSIEGVQQTAVRARYGFSFADAMRAFVRQDPDVILVGEIRDPETALEALRASQTGHLVLSTLHCNDAPDAVQRLVDLGQHPNSIAAELQAVLAQRLARRICQNCKVKVAPDPTLLGEVFPDGPPAGFETWIGEGCPRCHGRGLAGRIAVGELLRPGPAFQRAVAEGRPLHVLRSVALASGMVPLRAAALALVSRGLVPLAELRRMLPPDRMGPERD